MLRTITILGVVALCLTACGDKGDSPLNPGGPSTAGVISDGDLSLYPGSVFDVPIPPAFVENDATPGKNEKITAMFVGGPPQVPHGIQEFLPIDREDNGCIECHLIEKEEGEDAPLLPESHRVDLRADPASDTGATAGARWVCTACHVPMTDAKVLPECAPQK